MTDPHQTEVFERVVRPHFDRLYRLAWRLTGAKHEAEDLFQELLIKAFGMLDELVHIEEPGSWLCRVMYNQFVDQHRRFARQRMHLVDEGHLERLEKFRRLDAALQQLSEEHRLVVLLHDTEGYKLEEIESMTGTPVGTIKSRLHRARSRLRQILDNDGTIS
jgi:RNA polymerase sigma-70 factor (ECF subfamily)